MRQNRYSTPNTKKAKYNLPINPENTLSQVLKMQNLLDEYDLENDFLNKQVLELLNRNKILEENNLNLAKRDRNAPKGFTQ